MHALLVLGGKEIPFKALSEKADIIICADSGADYARNQEITPDVVMGDMDSVSGSTLKSFNEKGVKIITHPAEKDKTDGEIAVDYAKQMDAVHLDIVCVQGSIDHALGNLYLLIYAKNIGLNAKIITDDMIVYAADGDIALTGEKGTRVSILPADGNIEVKRTSGLYYEIEKPLGIAFGKTIGLGNHMTGAMCKITISKGTAFVIIERT